MIALTRVDFRLIHGQVITRWLKQCDINEIVTIDTQLSQDTFMQDVFKMAAPKGVKIRILSSEQAVLAFQNKEFDRNRIMLLFKNVQELYKTVMNGLDLKEIQIGGLGGGPGRKAVNNAITLDQTDADRCRPTFGFRKERDFDLFANHTRLSIRTTKKSSRKIMT